MCLAIPMKIIKIDGASGVAESEGLKRKVDLQFLKDPKVGDFVIIHAGFAIEKLDRKAAQETLDLYSEMR